MVRPGNTTGAPRSSGSSGGAVRTRGPGDAPPVAVRPPADPRSPLRTR